MASYCYYFGWKGERLIEILDMHTTDEELQKEAVKLLEEEGAI